MADPGHLAWRKLQATWPYYNLRLYLLLSYETHLLTNFSPALSLLLLLRLLSVCLYSLSPNLTSGCPSYLPRITPFLNHLIYLC